MNRRQVIAGADAAHILQLAGAAVAAETPSPVRALFEEWKALWGWVNEAGDDDEVNRRLPFLEAKELELLGESARDEADLALKIGVLAANDFCHRVDSKELAVLRPDVRRFFSERGQRLPGGYRDDPH